MGIRWVEDGEQSGWVFRIGSGRERLFVARKLGGKDAAQLVAQEEYDRQLALQPRRAPVVGRALSGLMGRFGRGGA